MSRSRVLLASMVTSENSFGTQQLRQPLTSTLISYKDCFNSCFIRVEFFSVHALEIYKVGRVVLYVTAFPTPFGCDGLSFNIQGLTPTFYTVHPSIHTCTERIVQSKTSTKRYSSFCSDRSWLMLRALTLTLYQVNKKETYGTS